MTLGIAGRFPHAAAQTCPSAELRGAVVRIVHGDIVGSVDGFVVLRAGNMGVKQGLAVVVGAAERFRIDPSVLFLLVGDGAERPRLEALARSADLPNIRFLPPQPKPVFLDLLACADVALVTQQRDVAEILFPSKCVTLLAAGRPLVASVSRESEVAQVISR